MTHDAHPRPVFTNTQFFTFTGERGEKEIRRSNFLKAEKDFFSQFPFRLARIRCSGSSIYYSYTFKKLHFERQGRSWKAKKETTIIKSNAKAN